MSSLWSVYDLHTSLTQFVTNQRQIRGIANDPQSPPTTPKALQTGPARRYPVILDGALSQRSAASLHQWGQRRLHSRTTSRILGGGGMNLGKVDFVRNMLLALATLSLLPLVWGHGRLMDPPARNSMWR